jgi:hypothetical protein
MVFHIGAILSYLELSGPISTKKRDLLCAAPPALIFLAITPLPHHTV